ncbi:1,2-phenylacetyl-CoA epoxidase subunit PaaC [Notoacmeibacter sp. MSK16QG-6]|uniref:1,2-phenylacetyl-CoA epoxidase subunit PaaC n=1 Tax=Notoacmeibacter sp. MSK16QG-6 TaxID=2957982 RepID=UPI0020A0E81E|nr:1,2-phenylacetyl-CoA epoxidase subunit PaaC [Notoacmeibacter sp. MSK16QG-6]MCP1200880.1 phenylacetate-CoA oxygenase subunit PaaC [Notoacmeibacter sp. MSK16QG-6]
MPSLPDMNSTDVVGMARRAAEHQAPRDRHIHNEELKPALFEWLCRMGDSTLILGHRLSEWCGHAPVLEEDIALANVALDLIGHTQMWLGLAGEVECEGRDADRLAFRRDVAHFRNVLLVEKQNGDIGSTLMRQFLFDAWHIERLRGLSESSSERVAEIAAKAFKEVSYHVDRSADLVIRLGDGTDESHRRMQKALDSHWTYANEMFTDDGVDEAVAEVGIAARSSELKPAWDRLVDEVFAEATLVRPDNDYARSGGKNGQRHTEHLGHLLAEMQFLQRAYPDASW